MKRLQGRRNRSGQPIKCPGLCNPLNQINNSDTSNNNNSKDCVDAQVDCKLSNGRQLIILRQLPENLRNFDKTKQTCLMHYVKIFIFYIICHFVIATLIRHHKYYPHFLAAQLCGLLTILLFPIWKRCRNL